MPESAEVRAMTEYLSEKLSGNIILDWFFLNDKTYKGYKEFSDYLPSILFEVKCKGKFIYFVLKKEEEYYYVFHNMRLTGKWDEKKDEHSLCYIEYIDQDNKENKIYYNDNLGFGTFEFSSSLEDLENILKNLGPDILTEDFNITVWKKLIHQHKNKNVTAFLMDQSIISGCGNYIKSEALHYSGISPFRKIGSLDENEATKLFQALRLIPRSVYNNLDYEGEEYEFVYKIYGKNYAKKSKTADGRITHWDPQRQY